MTQIVNPLLPAGYDFVWSVVMVAIVVLMVVALVSLMRLAKSITPGVGLVWALVVLLLPVVGPLAWLGIGRRTVIGARENAQPTQ